MITDMQRTEVATRMREILRDDPHGWLDMMVAKAVVDVMGEGVTIGETVADLIDRPTCEDVSDFDHEAFKCSRCGHRVLSLGGDSCDAVVVSPDGLISEYYYCPNCGKEVVE